jgi:glutathione peroxidase
MSRSIYDVQVSSWDGQEDFLSQYKGMVTLIVNVTANCGNAPQLETLEEIHNKYKNHGFAVVAVPTNDFCGPNITYGRYVNGIKDAAEARDYAIDTYNVSFNFSELVVSKPGDIAPKPLPEGKSTGELFKTITDMKESLQGEEDFMGGNFEKYLFNREGEFIKKFQNYTLLNYAFENAGSIVGQEPHSADVAYEKICKAIEDALGL